MRGISPGAFDASPVSPAAAAAAAAGKLRGSGGEDGSLEGRSAYSSWRYASARESSDSDGLAAWRPSPVGRSGSGAAGSRPATAVSWQAAGAALAAKAASSGGGGGGGSPGSVPAMGSPPTTASPDSGGAVPGAAAVEPPAAQHDRRLWSPSKQRGQPAAAAAAAAAGGPAALGGLAAPPGVDAASYAAGERAAFLLAFQQALPGQQALGQLFSAVDALHSRLEGEAAQWRQLQSGAARTAALLESAVERLDGLEQQRLPALQRKWEALACRGPPQELADAMAGLQHALALLAAQQQQFQEERAERQRGGGGGGSFARRQLHWLLLACAGYGQALLSKADVAALFLSRKILLVPSTGSGEDAAPAPGRQLLGALLFVAAAEAAYQAQQRALPRLPGFVQQATAPLQLGLRVTRMAVWSAALVLAAAHTRAGCLAASDRACGAVAAAAARLRLPLWVQVLPLMQRWRVRQCEAAAVGSSDCEAGKPGDGCAK